MTSTFSFKLAVFYGTVPLPNEGESGTSFSLRGRMRREPLDETCCPDGSKGGKGEENPLTTRKLLLDHRTS